MARRKPVIFNRTVVSSLIVILLIILVSLLFLYGQSMSRIAQAQEEAVDLIELDHPIKQVNKFDWVTMDQTYFSVDFTDESGNQQYAIIKQDGGDIRYYTPQDIIAREDALSITMNDQAPKELMQAKLGQLADHVVWEVSFLAEDDSLSYYYIDATTGQWLQTIANI